MLEMNLEVARRQMVDQQVRGWGVLDPEVARVMETLPRHRYVPERYRNLAYADSAIPIGHGEIMLQPSVQARMLQAAAVKSGERALEVGTGSGYLAACLAALGARVKSVDIHADFVAEARPRLAEDGIRGVELACEDTHTLAGEASVWDVILVTGSLPERDESFPKRLALGGRLVWIVGVAPAMRVELVTRVADNDWRREGLFETVVPALAGTTQPRHFNF